MCPHEHPSNIHAAAGFPSTFANFTSVSETFRQHSVRPRDLPSSSINILSVCEKHFVRKLDLPLNFRQLTAWLRDLPSSFRASAGPSVIFCKHSVRPQTSVNLHQLFMRLRDLLSTFHAAVDNPSTFQAPATLPSTSISFPYIRGTFCELSLWQRDLPSNFSCGRGHYVNFLCVSTTFRQLSSSFRASTEPSVNLHQLSVLLRNFPSIFHASTGPSVNFCQHSLSLRDIPSTFVKFP